MLLLSCMLVCAGTCTVIREARAGQTIKLSAVKVSCLAHCIQSGSISSMRSPSLLSCYTMRCMLSNKDRAYTIQFCVHLRSHSRCGKTFRVYQPCWSVWLVTLQKVTCTMLRLTAQASGYLSCLFLPAVHGGLPADAVPMQQQCLLHGRVWLLIQPGWSSVSVLNQRTQVSNLKW